MACPLFLPTLPLTNAVPADGTCAAAPHAPIDMEILRRCCNRGYARGECARAATSAVDAARFLIRADRDGVIEVAWAQERDHYPFAVGLTQYRPELGASADPLERQIASYVACYLRQKL